MAITTLDGVIAGTQPTWGFYKNAATTVSRTPMTSWPLAGWPLAGTYPNGTLAGGTYSSTGGIVTGQLPHFDPGGGLNAYLSRLTICPTISNGIFFLCDRLWDNGGVSVTSTASQTIGSPTWPARDVNGATAGAGVVIGMEVQAACASTTSLTLGYTNSAGTSGRTATVTNLQWNAQVVGGLAIFPLQAGDFGVQSVQSVQLTATMTSGTINLVAFRPIIGIDGAGASGATVPRGLDPIKGCFQRIYNGSVPFFAFIASGVSGLNLSGTYQESQG